MLGILAVSFMRAAGFDPQNQTQPSPAGYGWQPAQPAACQGKVPETKGSIKRERRPSSDQRIGK